MTNTPRQSRGIRLLPEVWERIERAAAAAGRQPTEYLRLLVEEMFANHKGREPQ